MATDPNLPPVDNRPLSKKITKRSLISLGSALLAFVIDAGFLDNDIGQLIGRVIAAIF